MAPPWPTDADLDFTIEEPSDDDRRRAVAVESCVAHIVATVHTVRGVTTEDGKDDAHFVLRCQVLEAYVRSSHWSGKTLEPQHDNAPPILSFLGSQRFGCVRPVPPPSELKSL